MTILASEFNALQPLWLILIAVLWIGFFVLEGFDFGVGMLVPFFGRGDSPAHKDQARRVVINTIGPHWDGNEVWLLTAGGATFAAFPGWYATLFSGLYLPLFLVLVGLIIRGVAFEYRSKREAPLWRHTWDWIMAIGSFIPALVLGVGFAWFVAGIPVGEGWGAFNVLEVFVAPGKSQGELLLIELTNMFALCGGLLFVALFLTHGAFFVALKTRGVIHDRARHYGKILGPVAIGLLLVFVLWGNLRMDVTGMAGIPWFPGNGALGAFQTWAWVAGILALLALSFSWFMNLKQRDGWAFIGTSVATAMLVAMVFCHMYPGLGFNTPSLIDMTSAASSHNTLFLMTIVALCCVPMVIAYTAWSYFFVFRRRLNTVSIPALSVTTPRHPARSRRVRSLNNR